MRSSSSLVAKVRYHSGVVCEQGHRGVRNLWSKVPKTVIYGQELSSVYGQHHFLWRPKAGSNLRGVGPQVELGGRLSERYPFLPPRANQPPLQILTNLWSPSDKHRLVATIPRTTKDQLKGPHPKTTPLERAESLKTALLRALAKMTLAALRKTRIRRQLREASLLSFGQAKP